MSKFRKNGKKSQPAVNTSALPDIVFMLLFFFMVSTTMKEVEVQVDQKKPEATEVIKIERKSLVDYIYVGQPLNVSKFGKSPVIQLDDQIYFNPIEIRQWKDMKLSERSEGDRGLVTTSLKIDVKVKMKTVNQIKNELREINALKINYSADRVENIEY